MKLILLLVASCLAQLTLVENDDPSVIRVRSRDPFRGQFSCVSEDGVRDFLEFPLGICNLSPSSIFLKENNRYILTELQDAATNVTLLSSRFVLPGLRDQVCQGEPLYTRGSGFTLSPECCYMLEIGVPCVWMDITNITLPSEIRLILNLVNHSTVEYTLNSLDLVPEQHISKQANGFLVMIGLSALIILLYPYIKSRASRRRKPL